MMFLVTVFCLLAGAMAGDPTLFFEWNVTYGQVAPLGTTHQGILINGQFPGPTINCTSNNNIVINVFNHLDEPFLLTWVGIQQRKNSWQDGTPGTMCPIQPGKNYTYQFQVKDQIGTFFYAPTTDLHRAGGGIGMIQVHSRALIPVPFDRPADEFAVLLGDWYDKDHRLLKSTLDRGKSIARPNGIHINGKSNKVGDNATKPLFTLEPGKTYRYRVCNVGLRTSINFRIQGHTMKLVEIEGSHTVQNVYDSLDIHVGQCMSVLVTADQTPKDYYFVASSRFLKQVLTSVVVIRYTNGNGPASPMLPPPPPENSVGIAWSINQFRSFRWNLTASAARPNPQGSYHYGAINISRTIKLANTQHNVNEDKYLRFFINDHSHTDPTTPMKQAEYFGKVDEVFMYDLVKGEPPKPEEFSWYQGVMVMRGKYKDFVEIIFINDEKTIQTWHLDGHSFFAVAMEPGKWSPEKRKNYNLLDAVNRYTIQVYPNSWAAVMTTLDNAGMWNLRSEMRERAYLGQQLYLSVLAPTRSSKYEYDMPANQELCGQLQGLRTFAPSPAPVPVPARAPVRDRARARAHVPTPAPAPAPAPAL